MLFISHVSSADGDLANRLVDLLEALGVSCWIAPRNILPGAQYSVAIGDALENCDGVVVLLSHAVANSAAVANEVEIGVGRLRKPVYVVRLANVKPPKSIALHVSTVQWIDAFDSLDATARVLADRVLTGELLKPAPNRTLGRLPRVTIAMGIAAVLILTIALFWRERASAPSAAANLQPTESSRPMPSTERTQQIAVESAPPGQISPALQREPLIHNGIEAELKVGVAPIMRDEPPALDTQGRPSSLEFTEEPTR